MQAGEAGAGPAPREEAVGASSGPSGFLCGAGPGSSELPAELFKAARRALSSGAGARAAGGGRCAEFPTPRGRAGLTAACPARAAPAAASGSRGARRALALKQAGQLPAFGAGRTRLPRDRKVPQDMLNLRHWLDVLPEESNTS